MKYCKFHIARLLLILISIPFLFYFCTSVPQPQPLDGLQWAVRMAESVMIRDSDKYDEWDYVTGTVMRGFEELWLITGERKYYNFIRENVDAVIKEDGTIVDYQLDKYNIDEINEGRMLLFLHKETGDEKYKKALEIIRSQLNTHPRTSEGGFWHKKRYPYQMWLDGLYMGMPFYTEYSQLFNEPENYDDIVNQFILIEKYTRDPQTGLLYHGWDEKKEQEWADSETGLSQCFWGRGIGWYAMALVDVLDYLPEEHPGTNELQDIFRRLAKAIAKVQDKESNVWWQVLDKPSKEGNYLEASASSMFVYALAKGVREGYICDSYKTVAEKGYRGIIDQFITVDDRGIVSLNQICKTAGLGYGRDGSFHYYAYEEDKVSNDGKGVGPFITASVEIHKLQQ